MDMVLRVALNAPLRRLFDYLPPRHCAVGALRPGTRLLVPFGPRRQVGILVETADDTDVPPERLRPAISVLDEEPVLDGPLLELLCWASAYYQHPIGEVLMAALPAHLRKGQPAEEAVTAVRLTREGAATDPDTLRRRAPAQSRMLGFLRDRETGCKTEDLAGLGGSWRDTLARLKEKNWIEQCDWQEPAPPIRDRAAAGPPLTAAQQHAATAIIGSLGKYNASLLFGVTGSGKTEVYLEAARAAAARGGQTLVLVPEIGLTPQLIERFRTRLDLPMALLHSGLTDSQRLAAWRDARSGKASIVLGTRSAIFAPLAEPALFIVDEEHDPSFKQQDGFRYSARDLAVLRARRTGTPVVLGSATPSLESLHNVERGRYTRLDLPHRPGSAAPPKIRTIDLRHHAATHGLSTPLIFAMRKHLDQGNQVLLYLNRRGYAPTLFCSGCGWVASCSRCDAHMTLHRKAGQLRCHHCGRAATAADHCPECAAELHPVGEGTQRIEETLSRLFPDHPVVRIDRDSIKRRGALEETLEAVRSGAAHILVGTQMLTKGHDFPNVTLVGILNADQGLFGTDLRASERLAQTILQVAGRAGRAEKPGEVLLQSLYPEHPLLNRLLTQGYAAFAQAALAERQEASWPPYTHLALLRAEASTLEAPLAFLQAARVCAEQFRSGVMLLGPAPAPMEKRAGRFRAQLLLQARGRGPLQTLLGPWIDEIAVLPLAKKIRWAIDVDPAELF
jgi:primosomal protein N' (replication factor Y)